MIPARKPLGRKAYGSIGHLPGSRRGPGDHHVPAGQAIICTEKVRDSHDTVIVQEKLDGSACAVARLEDDSIVALGRAGYLAQTSKYEQHQLFASWMRAREALFRRLLTRGERAVGEWLAQAHGTRYRIQPGRAPFAIFDLMVAEERKRWEEVRDRVDAVGLPRPWTAYCGPNPISVADALAAVMKRNDFGAVDLVEGAVWRVERYGRVDFLAKYVRPEKVDGRYLPEISGAAPVWNWRP